MGRVLAGSVGIGTTEAPPDGSEPTVTWTAKHIAPYMRRKMKTEVTITLKTKQKLELTLTLKLKHIVLLNDVW